MSVNIPKCAVVFGAVTVPQEDVIELKVHLGCTKEVSSFEALLQNWNGKYSLNGTYPILVGSDGSINIGRGTNLPQIITCRVEDVKYESTPIENYVRVSGRCWGEKLFRKVVTKTYTNKKGEEIVKDLMDNYAGLSHVRDSTELVEATDTTFTHLEYENTPVWDILKFIAESSDLAGVIGYDFRVAPDGKFEFFPKNTHNSPVSLSEKIEVAEYQKSIIRKRDKITVYGKCDRKEPAGGDEWTEPNLDAWVALSDCTLSLQSGGKVGSKYVQCQGGVSPMRFRHGFGIIVRAGMNLKFWFTTGSGFDELWLKIYAPDSDNRFEINLGKCNTLFEWIFKQIPLGSAQVYDALSNPGGIWTKINAADWFNVSAIEFLLNYTPPVNIGIDGLHFHPLPFRGTYGAGEREYTETDEELLSDNECLLRAKALYDYLSASSEYLKVTSGIIDYENAPILSGDRTHIELPNENIDTDFRIETAEYNLDAATQTLEITLELGKVPPMLADYLYGLRATTVSTESLARTKLGKNAASVGGGGGYGINIHHKGHEAGDDDGVQWTNPMVGGYDKITGWIAPHRIGPFDDVAAIIWFRTRAKNDIDILEHEFSPTDDKHGKLGHEGQSWKELWTVFALLPDDGVVKIRKVGESNSLMELEKGKLSFGPGGGTILDTRLERIEPGYFEIYHGFGPYSDSTAIIDFRTKNKNGSSVINHQFAPTDDEHGILGDETKKWKEIYSYSFFFPSLGYVRCKVPGENALMQLVKDALQFGAGGTAALDVYLKRIADKTFELKADFLLPAEANVTELGALNTRFKKIYLSDFLLWNHLLSAQNNTFDLGSDTYKWRDLYLSGKLMALWYVACNLEPDTDNTRGLGTADHRWASIHAAWCNFGLLNIGNIEVISSGRVLHNVTADIGIITSGRFPFARLPSSPSGMIWEGTGAGNDITEVDPNGRYAPASHNHSGEVLVPDTVIADHLTAYVDVHTGVLYTNYLNVAASVNCTNWHAANAFFANDFRITEAEKLGLGHGLAFLNRKNKVVMVLDGDGNLRITGEVKKLAA